MTELSALTGEEAERAVQALAGWTLAPDRRSIARQFEFADFQAAIGFMVRVAFLADRADHHPEWSNVYNRVHVVLTTHSVQGLSQNELSLAHQIDALCAGVAA